MASVKTNSPVLSDPEIMGGVPCFAGTRVPVKSLFDWLAHGHSIDYFLSQFPTVSRTLVESVLSLASDLLEHPPERAA